MTIPRETRHRPPQGCRAGRPAAGHLRDRLGRTADGRPAPADLSCSRRVRPGRRLAVQRLRARTRDRRPAADGGDDPAGPSAAFWWDRWLCSRSWSSPPRFCRTSGGSSPPGWWPERCRACSWPRPSRRLPRSSAKERVGRALGLVISGFSISTVLGLPLGVLVGSVLGWRGALLIVGGFAVIATGLLVAVAPSVPGSRLSGASGLRHALAPRVLAMLALSLTLFAAPGAVMGYLMPLLDHVTGVSGPLASAILMAYGVANVAGSFLGGRLADANAARALVLVTLGLVASSAVLYVARSHPLLAVVALLAWAVFGSSAPPSVQYRAVSLAGPGRRPRRLASRLRGERGHRPRLNGERNGLYRGRTVGRDHHRNDHRARRARSGHRDSSAAAARRRIPPPPRR